MHTDTGIIERMSEADMKEFKRGQERLYNEGRKMVSLTDNEASALEPATKRQRKSWMRNKPCVCGSGKKFKKCCWSKFK